jgi:hypothetical protein
MENNENLDQKYISYFIFFIYISIQIHKPKGLFLYQVLFGIFFVYLGIFWYVMPVYFGYILVYPGSLLKCCLVTV